VQITVRIFILRPFVLKRNVCYLFVIRNVTMFKGTTGAN
jgi:hypothetical protein